MANPKTFGSDFQRGRQAAIDECLEVLRANSQNSIEFVLPLVKALRRPQRKFMSPESMSINLAMNPDDQSDGIG